MAGANAPEVEVGERRADPPLEPSARSLPHRARRAGRHGTDASARMTSADTRPSSVDNRQPAQACARGDSGVLAEGTVHSSAFGGVAPTATLNRLATPCSPSARTSSPLLAALINSTPGQNPRRFSTADLVPAMAPAKRWTIGCT